ncbi:ATPase, V1/A1 complex, subunit E [Auricularia subglabra TFB-10046 SS5]|uniref:ATPase, V1/A1 complex, subunit E n=1 Tax=Auricularia subglabra (strain TFB-10046 / SS5) TaxID=717982 RepID=J0WVZ6_AURST|nr:ATPase, V1/A1 complex, subunit E [Auricularia subglabra TFB-10046 SS5]
MARPMNDDEVANEMNKMVTFIKQEALEKAREIRVKADEEFAIEKAKLVKSETSAIDGQYEKKRKQAEVAVRIAQSTQTNKSRLRLLQAREQHLHDLFDAARDQLLHVAADRARYAQLLRGLVLQGLLQLMEPRATVIARDDDVRAAQEAATAAAEDYKELTGGSAVEVDVRGGLPADGAGGVKLVGGSGKITIDNTLDERMRLLEDRMLPEIRVDLFGQNENRKFNN